MGCLAPGPDLLDEPVDELSIELAFEGLSAEDSRYSDIPLWNASLVVRPTWNEPPRSTEPEPGTRLFWRATVARWSIERRQIWGDRANALQDAGLDWKESERQAFEEIMTGLKVARK